MCSSAIGIYYYYYYYYSSMSSKDAGPAKYCTRNLYHQGTFALQSRFGATPGSPVGAAGHAASQHAKSIMRALATPGPSPASI